MIINLMITCLAEKVDVYVFFYLNMRKFIFIKNVLLILKSAGLANQKGSITNEKESMKIKGEYF